MRYQFNKQGGRWAPETPAEQAALDWIETYGHTPASTFNAAQLAAFEAGVKWQADQHRRAQARMADVDLPVTPEDNPEAFGHEYQISNEDGRCVTCGMPADDPVHDLDDENNGRPWPLGPNDPVDADEIDDYRPGRW